MMGRKELAFLSATLICFAGIALATQGFEVNPLVTPKAVRKVAAAALPTRAPSNAPTQAPSHGPTQAPSHRREPKKVAQATPSSAEPATIIPPDSGNSEQPARVVVQTYWNGVIAEIAMADAALYAATKATQQGDLGSASSLLEKAHGFGDKAKMAAYENVPDGWDDVKDDLTMAAVAYETSYQDAHDALDSNKPSDWAASGDAAASARAQWADAVRLARDHYVNMGGKAEDVSDGTTEAANARSLIDTLSAGASN